MRIDSWATGMFLMYVRDTGAYLLSARRFRYEAEHEKNSEMKSFYNNLADKDEIASAKAFGRSLYYRDWLEEQGVFLG